MHVALKMLKTPSSAYSMSLHLLLLNTSAQTTGPTNLLILFLERLSSFSPLNSSTLVSKCAIILQSVLAMPTQIAMSFG